ncbi:methyl-accepting chemotaxis protein [Alteromonas sp. KUL17]|uniref:methyl-accepting chemotaxis protein n=1 Tax=Alteromonas sp. KUL17 TaxID=2480796 RepID=UPI0010FFBFEE|nr:methyl-accepting chemotaxis protein [Alteromonas sp. KUL17]GEA04100.1 methyl-accepting chemotaxis protein [Alteromonas sp. KUL17]
MTIFSRLSVVQLTLIGTGTLFLSIAFLAYKDISQLVKDMSSAEQDKRLVTLVSAVERVAHHHAVERGLTAGYLGNPNSDSKQKIVNQRENADQAFQSLKSIHNENWSEDLGIDVILQPLFKVEANKGEIRRAVDSLNGAEAFGYYSELNKRALNAANAFTILLSDQKAKQHLLQGLNLARLKERLGQRRGKINAVLAKQSINPNTKAEINSYTDDISYLAEKLTLGLTGEFKSEFASSISSSTSTQVESIAANVVASDVNFASLPNNNEWFALATAQIGQIAKILSGVVETAKQDSNSNVAAATSSLTAIAVIIVVVTLFIALIYRVLIGIITQQLSVLVSNLDKIAQKGDLTIDVSMSTSNELGEISRSVNTTILALRDLIRGLGQSIGTSTRLSGKLEAACAEMLSDAGNTQQLTANIASAIEEVAVTSREIANSSLDTLNASKRLDELADQSLAANDNIRNSMTVLSEDIRGVQTNAAQMELKVTEISTILETINTLSDQTNLLALNAAIEAARAGDHGRGFAVVADEVRKLAQSSRESSDKISTLLVSLKEASVIVVNDINKNVSSISTSMDTTLEGRSTAEKVKEAASELENMANNMSSAAEQQSVTTEEVAKDVVSVEEAARHELYIAEQLSELSNEMQQNNDLLQRTIDGFKAD